MKKIVLNYIYLSRNHAGGKDQVGLNLLKGFQEIGVAKEMYVICFDYSISIIKTLSPDINIIPISSHNSSSEWGRMFRNHIVNSIRIPRIIKENKIDVIFHLDSNNGLTKFKCKSVVIPHDIKAIAHRDLPGLRIPLYKYILYKIMYKMDFKHADTIIGISDTDKGEIMQYYPKYKNKVLRIYDPIDIPVYSGATRSVEPRIVAINLQFHHKNIITLIKAYELIKDEIEEKLVLVGSVPDRVKYLVDYVKEHNLSDRIVFTGFVSEKERNDILQHSRLYVSPTLFEGFGMVSIEAIMSGVPTLVSKIPTNYEVTRNMCYYYEPAEDAYSLANQIKHALTTSISEKQLCERAQILYDEYNYIKISKDYFNLFQKV